MSNRNDFKLKLMDNIDESLVDRATAKRAKLMSELLIRAAAMKKKMIRFGSLAACLCILISAFTVFMVLLNRKQVPIYRGMSVSQLSPFVSADIGELPEGAVLFIADDERMMMLDNSGKHPNLEGNNGNHNGQLKDETLFTDDMTEYVTEEPTETPWDPNAEAAAPLFYAEQGKDFYVTVHIDNPDSFEILSFTLNGKKYSSYMFEEGSDMESLVLKCNAGDAVGILNYTIDAIKYIDGEKIKDVKMEGNKTVRVGIYSEQLMPTFSSAEVATSYDSFTVGGMVNDTYGLAEDGELYARIYEGTQWVLSMDITAGEPFLTTFDTLKPNTQYSFVIEGLFDDLSGVGAEMHVLYKHQFTTPALLTATVDSVGFHDATLSLHKHEHATGLVVDTIELYLGEEKIADLTGDSFTAEELLADNEYTLKLGYTDKEIKYTDELTFRTEAYIAKVEIGSVTSEKHSLGFEPVETDEHERGQITAIELWQGDQLIKSLEDLSARSFDGLYANNTYTLKITYTYDLLDGKGQQETVVEKELTTKAYKTPTANFSNLVFSPDSVGFDLEITDSDSVGQLGRIELWLGDELIATKGTDARAFEGLEVLNTYSVKAIYLCDMQDGKGGIQIEFICSIATQSTGLAISDGKVTGIGDCTDTTVYINMPVADNAFKENPDIEKVIIGPGATSIGGSAFSDCIALMEVVIHDSVTTIDCNAFSGCTALAEVLLPNSITIIEAATFSDCSSLTKIVIPANVKTIGFIAFHECSSLAELVLPDGLETIGEAAFAYCNALKTVTIPKSVAFIDSSAFSYFEGIMVVEHESVPSSWHPHWTDTAVYCNIKRLYTDDQGVTYVEHLDGTLTVADCDESVTSVVLPDKVVAIGDSAFEGCQKLKTINIPNSVTTIGDSAFDSCNSLTSVNIPNSVTTIGNYAFTVCLGLTEIVIPNSVTHIGVKAFFNCSYLKKVTIPNSVTSIGEGAFSACWILTTAYIPGSVTNIGGYCFDRDTTIFTEHAKKPGTWAYNWHTEGGTVYWGVKRVYTDDQGVTYAEHNDGTLSVVDCSKSATSVALPNKVTTIITNAFKDCNRLTSISISNGVTTIESSAFENCNKLAAVSIPNSVTTIGESAFKNCSALKEIIIPDSVTSIGESAFSGCSSMEKLVISKGLKSIPDSAFASCHGLTEVVIPDSVRSIGAGAFFNCSNLKNITIPNSVTSIGEATFNACWVLTNVYIPDSVTSIDNCAFDSSATVFAEHAEEPVSWHYNWHADGGTVYWNVKRIYTEGGKTYIEYNDGSVKPLS